MAVPPMGMASSTRVRAHLGARRQRTQGAGVVGAAELQRPQQWLQHAAECRRGGQPEPQPHPLVVGRGVHTVEGRQRRQRAVQRQAEGGGLGQHLQVALHDGGLVAERVVALTRAVL